MCQDTDSSKPNYTSDISVNPELIDVNMIQQSGGPGPGGGGGDWFHVNGVDYNEDLDQEYVSLQGLHLRFISLTTVLLH